MFRRIYIDDLVEIVAEYNEAGSVFIHANVLGEAGAIQLGKRLVYGFDESVEVLRQEGHSRVFALIPHSNTKAHKLAEINGFVPIVWFNECMLYDQEI